MIRLKELRKQNKISQEELAEKFALERTAISRWENGKSDPPLTVIIDLAKMFNVSTDYFLGLTDNINDTETLKLIDLNDEMTKTINKKLNVLDDTEKKDVIAFIDGILVRKKYSKAETQKEATS